MSHGSTQRGSSGLPWDPPGTHRVLAAERGGVPACPPGPLPGAPPKKELDAGGHTHPPLIDGSTGTTGASPRPRGTDRTPLFPARAQPDPHPAAQHTPPARLKPSCPPGRTGTPPRFPRGAPRPSRAAHTGRARGPPQATGAGGVWSAGGCGGVEGRTQSPIASLRGRAGPRRPSPGTGGAAPPCRPRGGRHSPV